MTGMFCIVKVPPVWCVARRHCQLNQIGFLRAASDRHLAADEKRPQFTHAVSRCEVIAWIVAGDEHRALDTDAPTAAAHHDGSVCRCVFWRHDRETACTMCLTTCWALLYNHRDILQQPWWRRLIAPTQTSLLKNNKFVPYQKLQIKLTANLVNNKKQTEVKQQCYLVIWRCKWCFFLICKVTITGCYFIACSTVLIAIQVTYSEIIIIIITVSPLVKQKCYDQEKLPRFNTLI